MSKIVGFGPKLKELRIILCQTSEASNGIRTFVSEHYMDLKDKNPELTILVRECSGVVPKIYARFEKGREVNVNVSNLSPSEILNRLHGMVTSAIMANSATAKAIKFYEYLLDLRIHYCPRSYVSRGTREFIDTYLPHVRKSNPGFPVFLIPYYGVEPWLYAR
ncbi:L51 S25 CI-B8 domain containing protein [Trichuris trichiura]|uniref:NADH dehydrogenase [ubiquinone] 1 alpha subcomplex subunit 2 n=1 Tax=Trichuris trichiura TaxID=36087 RepID=A0A077Z9G5_TRITR|nr:L51 S25 CI-B8 domain containing protein [Trichuris trichiura]